MKNLFPGYYRKNEEELNLIWQNGIIAFDTNVLLNLYRYSDSTKDTILDLIAKFSDKIWLPHQAALEYNRNRCEVISEQEKAYKEFSTKIAQIQSDLQSTSKPPFLTNDVDQELNESFKKVSSEVDISINKYSEYLKNDPIYNRLSEIFENKIGPNYTIEKLNHIFKEGEDRYKNKIPPGFEDEKNKEGDKKYGDLILWRQIIDKARDGEKAIILVTDERKKDWWWNLKDGRLMGPRHELVEEIKREANVNFHMYSSERFLSYGQEFLKEQLNKKAFDEIQAIKAAEKEKEYLKKEKFESSENTTLKQVLRLEKRIDFLKEKAHDINERINFINTNTDSAIYMSDDVEPLHKQLKRLRLEIEMLSSHKKSLASENNHYYISKSSYDEKYRDLISKKDSENNLNEP